MLPVGGSASMGRGPLAAGTEGHSSIMSERLSGGKGVVQPVPLSKRGAVPLRTNGFCIKWNSPDIPDT